MVGVKYISSRQSINIIYSVFPGQSKYTSDTSFEKRAMKAISYIFERFKFIFHYLLQQVCAITMLWRMPMFWLLITDVREYGLERTITGHQY